MLISRFAQSAAALLVLTIGLAAPAYAQNNKQIISGAWYEDRANTTSFSLGATLVFAQTPTDKFLNVTNISCVITTPSTQGLTFLTFYAGTAPDLLDDLGREYSIRGVATPNIVSGSNYYSIITNLFYKFGPGRYPKITVATLNTGGSLNINVQCVLVGNLTDN